MTAHILVVEDDLLVGKLLTYLLDDAGYTLTVLTDPRPAIAFLQEHPVDLVLLDIQLPFIDGYRVAKELRQLQPDLPVIFLSARAQVRDRVHGFEHGADHYIVKPFEPIELLARIEAVLRRYHRDERAVCDSVITAGDASLDVGALQFSAPGRPPVLLTPTEMKILECLMRNANAVITREALIERTWGNHCEDIDNRVDVYIRRVRAKIELDPEAPAFIRTIRGTGYLFRKRKQLAVV